MTGKTLQSQREDSPLLASQANGASYKTSSTSEASAKTSDAAFSRWRNDNDGSAGRKHAKRQMLCLQFSQILFMILDLASLVVITWWCLGSRVFWCMHWLAGRASLAWPADPSDLDFQVRFWGLPVVATLVKMVLLVLVMHRPQSKVLSVLFHALCLGFLVLLAVDSFELDALTQVEEEKHLLVGANVANSLPIIFTVLEVVNLNYLATSTSEKKPEDNLDKPAEEQPKGISFVKMVYILKPYFWPHGVANKVRASSTYIILIISKVTNLLAPLYMAEATNALLAKNVSAAIWNISAYALLTLTSKIFKELQSLIYLKVKQHAYIELATMTYEHVHKLSYDWHVRKKLGDVLRSMDRGVESANSMVSYVFLYLLPTLGESIVVVVIFAAHFQLASISFVAFLSLVVYAFLTIKITLWRKKFRQASTKHDNEYHDKATDALINYETIKYFSNERYEVDTYTKIIEKYQQYSISVQASLSLLNGSQSFIIQVTVLLTLALAAPHVVNDTGRQIDVGAFVAISVYLNNLFQPLFFLGSIYNMVINAVVDMQKLSELLSVEPDIVDSENAKELNICDYGMKNGIEVGFRDVYFHYPSQAPDSGVIGLTFTIPQGTTTALVGETGAGKTTISRLLFRFYDCNAGKILVNHQDISQVTQHSLRRAIGIVPQDTVLFNDTILQNIKYGNLDATFSQIEEAAKNARIYDFIMSLPEQWNTKVGERGLKLSGGEKQRVAIARTLLKDPPLVVLDEATSALDTVTEREIQLALNRLKSNRTMMIIAHRLSTIRNAHQILVLQNGAVAERGTHEELLGVDDGIYRRLWNTQLKVDQEMSGDVGEDKSA